MRNDTDQLKAAVIEHAMRIGATEAVVLTLAQSAPQTARAFSTLGRLMETPGVELAPGSPLVVWCDGGEVDTNWRAVCPARKGLWPELCDLRAMFSSLGDSWDDPYQELQKLRERADESLS